MTGMTVGGLVSGMDTNSVVSQLMQAEAIPQQQLQDKVSTENSVIRAYQTVNTKMTALGSAASALTKFDTWTTAKATSSSDTVVANAAAGAQAGALTFDIKSLAKAHTITSTLDETAPLTTAGTLTLTGAGLTDPLEITVDTDTPDGLAQAINAAAAASGANVRASVVSTDAGKMLQISSTKTGAANAFTLDGLTTSPKIATQGTDAQIQVGDPLAGGYTASSATNTFTGVMPGVTFTASKAQTDVTITVATDSSSLADKMQAMVDAANSSLSEISTDSAYDPTNKVGGPLTGDYTVRQLQQQILSNVSNGMPGYGSFSQLGLSLDSSGKLTFDKDKFTAALNANPAAVQDAVQNGIGKALSDTATAATDSTTGNITLALQGGTSQVKELNDRIADWDTRLADKKAQLTKQFADMEVALNKLKSQSSFLSGSTAASATSSSTTTN
jgi:flagellar hook-associated protein 2